MKRRVAWGASKLLKMYLAEQGAQDHGAPTHFEYVIDEFSKETYFQGLSIKRSATFFAEASGEIQVVIFAISSGALQQISAHLGRMGYVYGEDFIYYSDFFYDGFVQKASAALPFKLDRKLYEATLAYTLNSLTPVHTTVLGTWLFLEIMRYIGASGIDGSMAEVGAFQGGNALCAMIFSMFFKSKKYYIFDSFEGFPELTQFDPSSMKKGDYSISGTLRQVQNTFAVFPEVQIIKGFVPDAFSKLPAGEKFSCVFYDCDLYQPALDTYEYCWDKIVPGGFLIIHDHESPEGSYTGVKKATQEFFEKRDIRYVSFFENTMAIVQKSVT